MPIKMEFTIDKSTNHLKGTFGADATFMANGKTHCALSFGHGSIIEAAQTVINMIASMSPNAMQEEIDEYYKRWDEAPTPI